MNLQISGKHFELTGPIKQYVEDKIGGIIRLDDKIINERVIIEHVREDHHDAYRISVHVHVSHDDLHCEASNPDLYSAIDAAKDELERQLRDRKGKYHSQTRKAQKTQREMKSIFKAEELEDNKE